MQQNDINFCKPTWISDQKDLNKFSNAISLVTGSNCMLHVFYETEAKDFYQIT